MSEIGYLGRQGWLNGGTYAHWQIAPACAKWLPPELRMAVNSVYMRFKVANPNLALEVIDKQKDVEVLSRIGSRAWFSKIIVDPLWPA